jgi:hypothetical protein
LHAFVQTHGVRPEQPSREIGLNKKSADLTDFIDQRYRYSYEGIALILERQGIYHGRFDVIEVKIGLPTRGTNLFGEHPVNRIDTRLHVDQK